MGLNPHTAMLLRVGGGELTHILLLFSECSRQTGTSCVFLVNCRPPASGGTGERWVVTGPRHCGCAGGCDRQQRQRGPIVQSNWMDLGFEVNERRCGRVSVCVRGGGGVLVMLKQRKDL